MKHVIGLFNTYQDANNAVTELMDKGFDKDDISVLGKQESMVNQTETPDTDVSGTETGATLGATLGGLAGLLAGLGALAIPGIGPVVSAGTLAAALGSTAVGAGLGAVTGGLMGALVDMGLSEEEATQYVQGVERGGILVATKADDNDIDLVEDIYAQNNVVDIQQESRHRYTGSDQQGEVSKASTDGNEAS